MKPTPISSMALANLFGTKVKPYAGGFQHIGTAAFRGGGTIASSLATRAPAAAAANAEAVDTLNVLEPLPPVPQVSTRWV